MGIAGIDLGTTNSSVARLNGKDIQVFKEGSTGLEYTPSAVCMDSDKKLIVGVEARGRVFTDPKNATMEFKRNMGTDSPFTFERSGLAMQPEELSAEVLKTLNGHVVRSHGSPITSAVITVPADFLQPQWEATKRAAAMAGIKNCLLHPEPVAAAQAYSFANEIDNTFWLVYDFGGGTFDAAIIRVRDGEIDVVEHKGHNRLGGSDIDVAIVNELLIPALPAPFTDEEKEQIRTRSPKWAGAWAKLKGKAEAAKIALSNSDAQAYRIDIEYLCRHPNGEVLEYSYNLQRPDLDRLATPIIRQTINLVKEVLTAGRLSPEAIGKLILVGGPTMMPLVRNMLRELRIELEFGVDPLTVVAQGAAIIAATKFIGGDDHVEAVEGGYSVKLDYQPISSELEPEIAGTFAAFGSAPTDFTGFTVEFFNESVQPRWRSNTIPLSQSGGFMTRLEAQHGIANRFAIELCDPDRVTHPVTPVSLEIVVKGAGVFRETVHNHNIGVELANDEVFVFYQKGQPLPFTSQPTTFWTAVPVKKGASDRFLCVPVCEGERPRACRNRRIGELIIAADDVPMDVPVGSAIQVVVQVDANLVIHTTGRIALIDRDFTETLKGSLQSPDPIQLKVDAQLAIDRLARLRDRAMKSIEPVAPRFLQRIDEERMVAEITRLVALAANEPGAGLTCVDVLNRLNSSLDDLEDLLELPGLMAEAREKQTKTGVVVRTDEYAIEADRRAFAMIERELAVALQERSIDALKRAIESLDDLKSDVYRRDPAAWIGAFRTAKSKRGLMTDAGHADRLIGQGESAIRGNDAIGVKEAVRGLWELLPDAEETLDGRPKSSLSK